MFQAIWLVRHLGVIEHYSLPTKWMMCARFSLRIWVTGDYCKVTGGLLWKGKALSGNKQNLAGEFCVVAGEFSDLRCLMNTLCVIQTKQNGQCNSCFATISEAEILQIKEDVVPENTKKATKKVCIFVTSPFFRLVNVACLIEVFWDFQILFIYATLESWVLSVRALGSSVRASASSVRALVLYVRCMIVINLIRWANLGFCGQINE